MTPGRWPRPFGFGLRVAVLVLGLGLLTLPSASEPAAPVLVGDPSAGSDSSDVLLVVWAAAARPSHSVRPSPGQPHVIYRQRPQSPAAAPGVAQPVPVYLPPVARSWVPPMGWNGYNHYYHAVTAGILEAQARALVSSGMKAAGYTYVILDGGWNLPHRSSAGLLVPDPSRFPSGIKPVADYVHSLGLKFGLYADAGYYNCARTSAGSYGHYWQDARTFAAWGVDYLKLDWCNIPYGYYPGWAHWQVSRALASEMSYDLRATGRQIILDVNDPTGDGPWNWAPPFACVWRVPGDIHDSYASLVGNFTADARFAWAARPGAFNDPDMLEVGNGGMTTIEYQSQFSLWAMLAAPLIAGNDLTTMSSTTRSILTNRAVIAVDQDRLGRQATVLASAGGHWVLVKPLADGSRALTFFDQADAPASISVSLGQLGFRGPVHLVDLWSGQSATAAGSITASVQAHGVVMYRVWG